jgi:nitrile hydratase subunit beta
MAARAVAGQSQARRSSSNLVIECRPLTAARPGGPGLAILLVVSRVNDVGGQTGFGGLAVERDEPPFHADWEARVYAINAVLLRRGTYNLDQFRDAIERMPPERYLASSYYERWLYAIETLTGETDADAGDG